MIPLVTFPDARVETLAILRARAGTGGLLEGVTFGTKPYDVNAVPALPIPYVALSQDATSGRYPVVEVATIRVAVWGATEAQGLALAKKVRAVLLAYQGSATVRSFGDLIAPTPTTDPDSGGPLSFFTVSARLRPSDLIA